MFVARYRWHWLLGLTCCCGALLGRSKPASAAEPETKSASADERSASADPAPSPPVKGEPARRTPPTGWYVSEFVTGVSFATMQVALVWAIVDHDEPTKRDRALIVSGVAAVTALAALGTAALVLASDNAKQPRATAYVGLGGVGLSASF